jgi:antibiotic biosynthesis monooxygenase (ABM) superfamily enzyme
VEVAAVGAGPVEHRRTEYRTGIEGWFDEPTSRTVHEPGARETGSAAVRVLVTTLVATPWMTYVLLPFVTRLFGRWLVAA